MRVCSETFLYLEPMLYSNETLCTFSENEHMELQLTLLCFEV